MDRRIFMFFMAVLLFLPTNAQNSESMVQEGRTWNCQDIYPDDPHSEDPGYYEHDSAYYVIPRTYVLRGDTTIDANIYKKMYCNERYCCAMRQDNQKVFSVAEGTEEEQLNYDFSMEKGMSIMRQTEILKIEDVDMVFVEGIFRKRLIVYDDAKMLVDIWVEGIGSIGGPVATWQLGAATPVHEMVSCMQDGCLLFSVSDFFQTQSVKPTSYTTVQTDKPLIYDLQGRRLNAKPTKGVYIQNGKKYVMK